MNGNCLVNTQYVAEVVAYVLLNGSGPGSHIWQKIFLWMHCQILSPAINLWHKCDSFFLWLPFWERIFYQYTAKSCLISTWSTITTILFCTMNNQCFLSKHHEVISELMLYLWQIHFHQCTEKINPHMIYDRNVEPNFFSKGGHSKVEFFSW